jgi:hypothetical protein
VLNGEKILVCFRTGDRNEVSIHQQWWWPEGVRIADVIKQIVKVTTKDPKGYYLRKEHRPVSARLLTTYRKVWEADQEGKGGERGG